MKKSFNSILITVMCIISGWIGGCGSCGASSSTGASSSMGASDAATAHPRDGERIPDSEADLQSISPAHPLIRYVGRVDFSKPEAPCFSFPGVSIRLRFNGTRLQVLLDDNALHQAADTTNYFNVIVDGGEPVRLKTVPEQKVYVLAENLNAGPHEVELFKLSESSHGDHLNVGKVTIRGFRLDRDATLLPPSERKLKMEFIGDSITCGYGNELSVANPMNHHFTTRNSNAYMAWGAIAARQLDAEYVAVAYSGRGVVRNYGGFQSPVIPEIYLSTLPDDPDAVTWDTSAYTPDIVVINLGTNDFSEGVPPGDAVDALERQYADGYARFLERLLSYYGNAQFILAVGPMLSDSFPPGVNAATRVKRVLHQLVDARKEKGNTNVHVLALSPQQPPFGEDFHPTVATHQKMATELVAFIRSLQ
jgi:lysophospholipase L1-like esterase